MRWEGIVQAEFLSLSLLNLAPGSVVRRLDHLLEWAGLKVVDLVQLPLFLRAASLAVDDVVLVDAQLRELDYLLLVEVLRVVVGSLFEEARALVVAVLRVEVRLGQAIALHHLPLASSLSLIILVLILLLLHKLHWFFYDMLRPQGQTITGELSAFAHPIVGVLKRLISDSAQSESLSLSLYSLTPSLSSL